MLTGSPKLRSICSAILEVMTVLNEETYNWSLLQHSCNYLIMAWELGICTYSQFAKLLAIMCLTFGIFLDSFPRKSVAKCAPLCTYPDLVLLVHPLLPLYTLPDLHQIPVQPSQSIQRLLHTTTHPCASFLTCATPLCTLPNLCCIPCPLPKLHISHESLPNPLLPHLPAGWLGISNFLIASPQTSIVES